MSVAPELPPTVAIPARAAHAGRARRQPDTHRQLALVADRRISPGAPTVRGPVSVNGRSAGGPRAIWASACERPAVPEVWIEPVVPSPVEWDLLIEDWAAPAAAVEVAAVSRPEPLAGSMRLTARGRIVVALLAVAVAGALIVLAAVGASAQQSPRPANPAASGQVVVGDGDTLWSIARRVAPGADPRREVAVLQRLNHLPGATVLPGQVLRTR